MNTSPMPACRCSKASTSSSSTPCARQPHPSHATIDRRPSTGSSASSHGQPGSPTCRTKSCTPTWNRSCPPTSVWPMTACASRSSYSHADLSRTPRPSFPPTTAPPSPASATSTASTSAIASCSRAWSSAPASYAHAPSPSPSIRIPPISCVPAQRPRLITPTLAERLASARNHRRRCNRRPPLHRPSSPTCSAEAFARDVLMRSSARRRSA